MGLVAAISGAMQEDICVCVRFDDTLSSTEGLGLCLEQVSSVDSSKWSQGHHGCSEVHASYSEIHVRSRLP